MHLTIFNISTTMYWRKLCILQPYDMEVGRVLHPATTFTFVRRRPIHHGDQPMVVMGKPLAALLPIPSVRSPPDKSFGSLEAIGIDMSLHDIRFVEDDWESPTLGAWGLGWEVWCDGMEVSQFTYFQQVGGHDCHPVSGELTYGLERLAMYILKIDHVMDMPFNDPQTPIALSYGDIFRQTEEEYARWNFDVADTEKLFRHFEDAEQECEAILQQDKLDPKTDKTIIMAHPAYDQCMKASHLFNLLDARGVISVTERQAYIARVRALAKKCADAFVMTRVGGGEE